MVAQSAAHLALQHFADYFGENVTQPVKQVRERGAARLGCAGLGWAGVAQPVCWS